ncbi:MAG: sigma-70 family RNA polymerase sigma factor [Eubacteriaceae bacterium]|nr:sigma-70 family RNA polymerase sigma factor [Eubacteriaceae bacterium]
MYKKVEICGISTDSLPKVGQAQTEMMLTRLKNGDESIREEFIRCNLRLVLSVIRKFGYRGENMDDIFQIGCIGLIKAINNFDLKYDVKFSTYAVPMIAGEVKRYLRDAGAIRVSRSIKDVAYKAMKIKESNPSAAKENKDIAQQLGISVKKVDEAMKAICEPASLHEYVFGSDNDGLTVMDQLKDEKNIEDNWVDNIALKEAVASLDEKEMLIINLRYYKGRTQNEVAKKIGISQAQVSRIEKNALAAIKRQMT